MVPVDSEEISPVPPYSGFPAHQLVDVYRTLTVCGCPSQSIRLLSRWLDAGSYYPRLAVTKLVWAVPRSLATTDGITDLFSLPAAT